MKITYLKTIGFRKFEGEFETYFYDITSITGGNTKGKTNILYAIIWAFLGTNLTGDDKVWLGNKNSEDCYVKLKFIDNNGSEHLLERYKNKYDNKRNFTLLDNKKAEIEELQSFYNDKKLFLSILNPNYFINKKPVEQKALIDKYLPDVEMEFVYNKLEETEKEHLEGCPKNVVDYLKELNENKTMYENKIKNLQGKIEYAMTFIENKPEEQKIFKKEEELSLARQELSFLNSDNTLKDREKQAKLVENIESQIAQLENQIKEFETTMLTDKKIYLSIKNQEVSYCPMCEQEIKAQSKIATITNMKADLVKLFEKTNALKERLLNLKSQLIIERCRLHSLDNGDNLLKKEQIVKVQAQINILEQEKLEIQNYNSTILAKINNAKGAKQDIEIFKENINKYNKLLDNLKQTKKIAEKLYINYLEEKMKFASKHLKNVTIKYYSILKDSGELKEDFIIMYKNNELKNLSRSETIATSLELCNMFNKISNVNIPLFIDDSESCADYNFIEDYSDNTQILIARVDKGQELKIQNNNIEEYKKVA